MAILRSVGARPRHVLLSARRRSWAARDAGHSGRYRPDLPSVACRASATRAALRIFVAITGLRASDLAILFGIIVAALLMGLLPAFRPTATPSPTACRCECENHESCPCTSCSLLALTARRLLTMLQAPQLPVLLAAQFTFFAVPAHAGTTLVPDVPSPAATQTLGVPSARAPATVPPPKVNAAITSAKKDEARMVDWDALLPDRERANFNSEPPPPLHDYLGERGAAARQTGSPRSTRSSARPGSKSPVLSFRSW